MLLLLTVNIFFDFEQANIFGVHTEKINIFEDRIFHAFMLCSILSVKKIYEQVALELIPSKPYR